jgi:hypothetical protein
MSFVDKGPPRSWKTSKVDISVRRCAFLWARYLRSSVSGDSIKLLGLHPTAHDKNAVFVRAKWLIDWVGRLIKKYNSTENYNGEIVNLLAILHIITDDRLTSTDSPEKISRMLLPVSSSL